MMSEYEPVINATFDVISLIGILGLIMLLVIVLMVLVEVLPILMLILMAIVLAIVQIPMICFLYLKSRIEDRKGNKNADKSATEGWVFNA